MKRLILFFFFVLSATIAFAQHPPRIDDHFHRRKVRYRLDLQEKVNKPIIKAESELYLPEEGKYRNKKGLINALLSGFERAEFVGYDPDSLEKKRTYDQLMTLLKNIESGSTPVDVSAGTDNPDDDNFDDEDSDVDIDEEPQGGDDVLPKSGDANVDKGILASLQQVCDIVEDRIFDKNKSDMYYDVQWISLNFVDLNGALRDRAVVMFKYKDVMDVLNNTQWKNRFNDAEYRTLQEIIELRLFNSFNLEISGNEVLDIGESETRRLQLVMYEHYLWNY